MIKLTVPYKYNAIFKLRFLRWLVFTLLFNLQAVIPESRHLSFADGTGPGVIL